MFLRLRDALELQAAPDDSGGKLVDPFLERTVTLGPTGIALVRKLDGSRDLEQLTAELLAAGFARQKIEDTLRLLALLHLFDGVGDGVRARMASIWAGDVELEYRAVPGARFACQGSGMCCRSYRLGPVTRDEVASIYALPLRESFPSLPEGELFVEREGKTYLRSIETGCVFLQDDHTCGLHATFGENAKPEMCRSYPVGIKLTFEAALVYNIQQCATHFVSQADGPPLVDSARLMRQRRTGRVRLFHPIVFVREDTAVDYAHFLVLEDALRDVVGQGSPFAQLVHALDVHDSFVAVARSFPVGSDPATAFATWRSGVSLRATSRAPRVDDWDRALAALDPLVAELELFLANLAPSSPDRDMAPLVTELLPMLELLRQRVREHAPLGEAPTEDVLSALRTSLVQRFHGALSLPADRPLTALGEAALAILAGFAGAALDGRPCDAEAIGRGHAIANRVLPTFTTPTFRQHPEWVRALVRVLGPLCGG